MRTCQKAQRRAGCHYHTLPTYCMRTYGLKQTDIYRWNAVVLKEVKILKLSNKNLFCTYLFFITHVFNNTRLWVNKPLNLTHIISFSTSHNPPHNSHDRGFPNSRRQHAPQCTTTTYEIQVNVQSQEVEMCFVSGVKTSEVILSRLSHCQGPTTTATINLSCFQTSSLDILMNFCRGTVCKNVHKCCYWIGLFHGQRKLSEVKHSRNILKGWVGSLVKRHSVRSVNVTAVLNLLLRSSYIKVKLQSMWKSGKIVSGHFPDWVHVWKQLVMCQVEVSIEGNPMSVETS